MIDHLVYSFVF